MIGVNLQLNDPLKLKPLTFLGPVMLWCKTNRVISVVQNKNIHCHQPKHALEETYTLIYRCFLWLKMSWQLLGNKYIQLKWIYRLISQFKLIFYIFTGFTFNVSKCLQRGCFYLVMILINLSEVLFSGAKLPQMHNLAFALQF